MRRSPWVRRTRGLKQSLLRLHDPDICARAPPQVTPDNQEDFAQQMRQYAIASDCPIFDRMFEYCQMNCGGSIGGAARLNYGLADAVINWSGGMHHAKKSEVCKHGMQACVIASSR